MTLISDISSYQSDSLSFMRQLKNNGVNGLMVKLTDNTNYLNPKAGMQVTNGFKAGMKSIGLYHYFHGNGKAEATYFLKWVKAFKMGKDTPLAIDVEEPTLPGNVTSEINVFLSELKKAGFVCRVIYGSAYWFNSGRIKYAKLDDKNIWVASYGTAQSNVPHTNAWQFTDNFKGMHVDASHDYDGTLTGEKFSGKLADKYLSNGSAFKVITDYVTAYKTPHFSKDVATKGKYTKGSVLVGKPVKIGRIYRIKLDGTELYITANDKFVKAV